MRFFTVKRHWLLRQPVTDGLWSKRRIHTMHWHLRVRVKSFRLDLSGNQITDASASRLSKALKQSTMPVTSLSLGGNQITDAGAPSLSEALKQSTSQLTALYLAGNQITKL